MLVLSVPAQVLQGEYHPRLIVANNESAPLEIVPLEGLREVVELPPIVVVSRTVDIMSDRVGSAGREIAYTLTGATDPDLHLKLALRMRESKARNASNETSASHEKLIGVELIDNTTNEVESGEKLLSLANETSPGKRSTRLVSTMHYARPLQVAANWT